MRQIVVLSVALAASLVWAYVTWTDEEEEVTDDVVKVYTGSETDLQKVAWNSADLTVVIERKKDDRGEYLWVDTTETKRPKKPTEPDAHPGEEEEGPEEAPKPGDPPKPDDPAPADGAPPAEPVPPAEPEPPPEVKTSRFMANKQGEDLWKSFGPLVALRELDISGAADKSVFGLDDADPTKKAAIEVVRGSGPVTLNVGGETYGNKDRYVEYNSKIYLIDDATLRPLQFAASRLVERSLFPFQESDIEKVDVQLPSGKALSWLQQNRDDRAKAFWATAAAPDKEDEVGGTWLGKVFKLKLKEYADQAAVTAPLEPVLTYTVSAKDGAWTVEVLKTGAEPPEWYARSAYNRSLVTLTESLARNVVDDLDSLQGE